MDLSKLYALLNAVPIVTGGGTSRNERHNAKEYDFPAGCCRQD